jgi:S-adenosylmethionine decarboxylase
MQYYLVQPVYTGGAGMEYNGLHLTIDARLNSEKGRVALADPTQGVKAMESIVHRIDMTMILPPITVNFPHAISEATRILEALEKEGLAECSTAQEIRKNLKYRVEQAYGYTAILVIAESHISLHTFPEENFFTFDCYSCKSFDVDAVIDELKSVFGGGAWDVKVLNREIPNLPEEL